MPDYSKAVIYKIETCGQLYVGSTCNYAQRKYMHKSCVNFKGKDCTTKLYNTIRENNGEWVMIPIKEFPCESKLQLLIEEEKWRKELGATLNTNQCYCTDVEKRREQIKQYNENNKEKRREMYKQYNEKNKEKVRERQKQYREKNKEKISEKRKQYNEKNKEHIRERKGQKSECPICGLLATSRHMKRHQQSKKCKVKALQLEHNH